MYLSKPGVATSVDSHLASFQIVKAVRSGVMIVTENCWHVCIVLSHLRNKKSQFKLPGMASLEFDDAFGQ